MEPPVAPPSRVRSWKVDVKTVNDNLLHEMTRRLVEQFQPEQIILFGSQVWGMPTSSSDIDLMVIVSGSNLSDYERSVLGHRCLSGLDIAKDVVVRTRAEFDFFRDVRASLEYKIAHQGKVLYDRRQSSTRAQLAHQGEA
jgi:predicted nucleotidyltransferase